MGYRLLLYICSNKTWRYIYESYASNKFSLNLQEEDALDWTCWCADVINILAEDWVPKMAKLSSTAVLLFTLGTLGWHEFHSKPYKWPCALIVCRYRNMNDARYADDECEVQFADMVFIGYIFFQEGGLWSERRGGGCTTTLYRIL